MNKSLYLPQLSKTIQQLSDSECYEAVCHEHKVGEPMPSIKKLEEFVLLCREILFPGYFDDNGIQPDSMQYYIGVSTERLYHILVDQVLAGLCFVCDKKDGAMLDERKKQAMDLSVEFVKSLPELRSKLAMDVNAAYLGDPAAKSMAEIIFCYPAIRAISNYRIAHQLVNLGIPIIPRIISEMAHSETGIDIHPKAEIGDSFCIDHGTGVVIGATSIIGKNVKLFQGVTLGAKSFPLDEEGNPIKGIPRHPILEDDVIIYSNASILGRVTIGKGSVIGGNVWVTQNVAPNSKLVQMKARDLLFNDGAGI